MILIDLFGVIFLGVTNYSYYTHVPMLHFKVLMREEARRYGEEQRQAAAKRAGICARKVYSTRSRSIAVQSSAVN